MRTEAVHRAQAEAHRWGRVRTVAGLERVVPPAPRHIHRVHPHAVALRILDERPRCVEPHRLRVEHRAEEFRRVVVPQVGARVHQEREARRMALGEAVVGEGVDLVVDALRDVGGDPVARHPVDHPLCDRRHPLAAPLVPHRLAELVGLPRREPRRRDRYLHPLLLEERHAERAPQDRLERGVRIGDRLGPGAPSQVRVHHRPLDWAGPDERDLHHEVVEGAWPEARQGVHLRAALHLEDAHGVGSAEVVVDRGVGAVELAEVDRHAACASHRGEAVL